ncbi:hypothetical protein O8E95_002342 [Enterobacter quasiroggenkampii]
MNYAAAIKAGNELPFLGSNSSQQDYEDALAIVEHLIEHDPDSPLVEMLTREVYFRKEYSLMLSLKPEWATRKRKEITQLLHSQRSEHR